MGLNARAADFGKAMTSQTLTLSTGAVSTLTVPAGTQSALITARSNGVSYAYADTDPTPTVGHLIQDGGNIEIFEPDLSEVGFIAQAGSPSLFITYFKEV